MKKLLPISLFLTFGHLGLVAQQPAVKPAFDPGLSSKTRQIIPLGGDWIRSVEGEKPVLRKIPFTSPDREILTLKKSVNPGDLSGRSVSVVTGGVNFLYNLYVNDQFAGSRQGAYSPARLPLSQELLKPGEPLFFRLELDGTLNYHSSLPLAGHPGDPRQISGILAAPYLEIAPSISVDRADLNPVYTGAGLVFHPVAGIRTSRFVKGGLIPAGKPAAISVWITVTEKSTPSVPVFQSVQTAEVLPDRVNEVIFPAVPAAIKLWDPASPDLYSVSVTVFYNDKPVDQISWTTGFKSVSVSANTVVLNGNPAPVRGVSYLEEYGDTDPSKRKARLVFDLRLIRSAGMNAVRFWGYPPSDLALSVCDSLGLLVYAELPAVNIPVSVLEEPAFSRQMEAGWTDLLLRLKSHPSVVAVGTGGPFTSQHSPEFLDRLAVDGKKSAPGILFYAVTQDPGFALRPSPYDMVGFDLTGMSADRFTEVTSRFSEMKNPFIAAFGMEIRPGNQNGYSDPSSLQAQAKYFMDRIKLLETIPNTGTFAFTFRDFTSESPRLVSGGTNPNLVTTGLINYNNTFRPAMDMIKALYTNEVVFNPPVGKFSFGVQVVYPITGVIIIFFFSFFYSSNKRFRDNLSRSSRRSFSFFSDVRDGRIMVGLQSTGLLFLLIFTVAGFFLSLIYSYRSSASFDYLLSVLLPFNWLKDLLITWAWNPVYGIPLLSLMILTKLLVMVFAAKVIGWLIRMRLSFSQILIAMVWSLAPALVLVFPAMLNEQLVPRFTDLTPYLVPLMVAFLIFLLFRVLRALRIVLVASPAKLYSLAFGGLALLFAATWLHYEYHYNLSASLAWWFSQKAW
ncbi:MAG: hypothetical protein L6Q77_10265 [Bacteroidetes bacterium]|nr:hypothetical protein [Bacteroidota bacterium]